MIVSITRGNHTEFPERCLLQHREKHHLFVCGHPEWDERQTLYCNYCSTPAEFVGPPSRCPLVHSPLDGLKVEMTK